jgi:hypothetical protein
MASSGVPADEYRALIDEVLHLRRDLLRLVTDSSDLLDHVQIPELGYR